MAATAAREQLICKSLKLNVGKYLQAANNHWGIRPSDWQIGASVQHEIIQGGTSTGRGVRDNCEITAALPEIIGTAPLDACHVKPGTGGVGGNDSASNGAWLNAKWFAPSSAIVPALGRPLAGGRHRADGNLLVPGQQYGDRVNQVNLRAAKIIRLGRTRTFVGFDLYNLFNANPGLTYNQAFATAYLRPTSILIRRFVRFNATVDF